MRQIGQVLWASTVHFGLSRLSFSFVVLRLLPVESDGISVGIAVTSAHDTNMLTNLAIRQHFRRTPHAKKLSDAHGLYLFEAPSGAKLWRMNYRFAGKQRTLSFGDYQTVTLADARTYAGEARELLRHGKDPMAERRARARHHVESAALSLRIVLGEWSEMRGRVVSPKTLKRDQSTLRHLPNRLLSTAVGQIEPPDLLAMLQAIPATHVANRLKTLCSLMFRYAIGAGYAMRDPTADLRGLIPPPTKGHFPTMTDPSRVGGLLRAMDSLKPSSAVRALRFLPHVFVRPQELRLMKWADVKRDRALWIVPADDTKQRAELLMPLSRQALEMLEDAPRFADSSYVFPSPRGRHQPLSNTALNATLRRIGYEHDDIVSHGFRAMARTMLDEQLRFEPTLIEVQLGHAVPGALGDTYNRARYLDQRAEMMQRWSDYLDELRAQTPTT